MATYNELEQDGYYLIREKEGADIILVQPLMQTAQCWLLTHIDEIEMTIWKKKDDIIFEIIEQLTDEQVFAYQQLFDGEEDDYSTWEDEEPGYSFEEEEEDEDELNDDEIETGKR